MADYNNYLNFNMVNAIIANNCHLIPQDIDLIVGIPRSGLIVSTLMAEYTNLPSTDLFSYLNGVENYKLNQGSYAPSTSISTAANILLVDDAMGYGITMERAKMMILQKCPTIHVTTCVPFVESYSINKVDIYFMVMKDQFFPWSVIKRGISDAMVDIDGVLTEDVPAQFDDDGSAYINFLTNQRPKIRPDRKINTLVTGRLAKYRDITVNWLNSHNVQFGELIMCPLTTKQERDRSDMGRFKGEIFAASSCPLFIESDFKEASTIKIMNTNKPVYCMSIASYIR